MGGWSGGAFWVPRVERGGAMAGVVEAFELGGGGRGLAIESLVRDSVRRYPDVAAAPPVLGVSMASHPVVSSIGINFNVARRSVVVRLRRSALAFSRESIL